jgi:sigma-B regulation protein RsbU (phosphoserine phosphatase)
MFPNPEAMTVAPIPPYPSQDKNPNTSALKQEITAVQALKELVANLQKEQTKIHDVLSALGFALRSFSNLNQFLALTPMMTARVTDAEGGVLILLKGNDLLRLEQIHCHDNQLRQQLVHALEKISHQVNSSRNSRANLLNQSSQLSLTQLDEAIRHELGDHIQVFGTPIIVESKEQGRLYAFSRAPEYAWTTTRRKLAQLVADQTAVAIANHDLTVKVRSKQRQDRELEIASEIQLRLLPTKCPQIKGIEIAAECKTANLVGGDYYDFIPTNYDQICRHQGEQNEEEASLVPWSIVIGDVMGKGVPAGLIMTMTRGMLRAEVLNRNSPAQIMQHLNRVMYSDLENSHRFVSMFYSEYDPKTQMLSFTNAAHNPPIWWQAATNSLEKLDTWGMLIGLDPESEYEDAQVKLAPGDTIMYYTDGFTDAVNPSGDRFDEENLSRAFRWACQHFDTTQEILNYLFDEVERFTGQSTNNTDDMTLIVMQIKAK